MLAVGSGVRGQVGLLLASALVAAGCTGNETLPRVGPNGNDQSMGGAAGSGSGDDGSGGNTPDGGTGAGSGALAEVVPHLVYIYGNRAGEETRQVCEVLSDVVVGTSSVNYTDIVGQVHPLTGEIWTLDGGTDSVKDINEHEDACAGIVEDFSFQPATGELASQCQGVWYDETGAETVRAAKYRDEDGRFFDQGALFDATGSPVVLDTPLPVSFAAVHSRPGGGFFVAAVDEGAGEVSRYAISSDGSVTVATARIPGGTAGVQVITFGAAIDELGGVWLQGPSAAHPHGAFVRLSSDLSSAEVVYSEGQCDTTEYWGVALSTP